MAMGNTNRLTMAIRDPVTGITMHFTSGAAAEDQAENVQTYSPDWNPDNTVVVLLRNNTWTRRWVLGPRSVPE